MFNKSAFDCWSEEAKDRSIITLCKQLDACLGGGVPPKVITEFCGAPGTGKTQMCLQLCVNVQFPQEVGGIGGEALFIDTNQGFSPRRLQEIAQHCAERYIQTYKRFHKQQTVAADFNSTSILNNVSYIYCKDYVELLTTLETVKCKLGLNKNVRLLAIDSFSFLFRSFEDNTNRTRIIYEILTDLQQMADKYDLAVVITNELTTRIANEEAIVCPALGDSLAHKVGQRIILSKLKNEHNVAFLAKSYFVAKTGIPFRIKDSGIRGLE
ncbi:DNA repair protein RAD51 homolog 3 [Episyrphus balteatus]|uniref:DNA repair protein RAD51 homolog 3 n=1 Tax=Episyrphus balteatus TaxID=286459 RepID=UPI002485C0E1|nr:DNA repair protein RAD51 homolog 3 [Episyrphus balteatus]